MVCICAYNFACAAFCHYSDVSSSNQPIWLDDFPCVFREPCVGNCIGCPSLPSNHACSHPEDMTIECCKLYQTIHIVTYAHVHLFLLSLSLSPFFSFSLSLSQILQLLIL